MVARILPKPIDRRRDDARSNVASTQPTSGPARLRGRRAVGKDKVKDKSVPQVLSELKDLTIAYAKQEIQDPLKGVWAYLGWGVATMVLLGTGSLLLVLGALRALQTETGSTFSGNLTWAPYGIVFALACIALGIVGTIVTRDKPDQEKDR